METFGKNKITAEIIGLNRLKTTPVNWNGVSFEVKPYISMADMLDMVKSVTSLCVDDDGSFLPEVRDFAEKYYILDKYTNLELPEDTSEQYDVIYGTDLVSCVIGWIGTDEQIAEIHRSIDAKISHIARSNVEFLRGRVNDMLTEFDTFMKVMSSTFDGVDPDAINNLASVLSNKDFSKDIVVEAITQDLKDKAES